MSQRVSIATTQHYCSSEKVAIVSMKRDGHNCVRIKLDFQNQVENLIWPMVYNFPSADVDYNQHLFEIFHFLKKQIYHFIEMVISQKEKKKYPSLPLRGKTMDYRCDLLLLLLVVVVFNI